MMDVFDILHIIDTSSEDDDDDIGRINRPRRPKIIRARINHFDRWDEIDFRTRFRISKNTVRDILQIIEPSIAHTTNRNHVVSPLLQLLMTLRFYATGSFLIVMGDFIGVHKSTACKIIHRVTVALARLRPIYIRMPTSHEEIKRVRQGFFNIARFPRCIGAIDCTHVKILSPGGDNAEVYRNRKSFFSINVQTIASYDLKIQNIVARWPGSAHDSNIFNNSAIRGHFEGANRNNSVIVGDSGYPIKPYLITPLANPIIEAEELFNESQIRTRNPVERSYGVWKRRFPILALGRCDIANVEAIIVAIAVIHNIAIEANEVGPLVNQEEEAAVNFVNEFPPIQAIIADNNNARLNNRTRHGLIHEYFANL